MARTVSVVLAVTLLSAGVTTAYTTVDASPAEAHVRLVSTVPENHAHIDTVPERVTVVLEGKPVTAEGDPLRVIGPTGDRVDAGDVRLVEGESDDDPTELSVALSPEIVGDLGEYHVVYRVVSGDTHLVAGRFMFHYGEPDPAAVLPIGSSPSSERLAPGWPEDRAHWPKVLFGVAVAVALVGFVFQRWRRSRRQSTVVSRAAAAGLFAGRRLD